MALIFLWAFFDKLFGLGFATPSAKAWIHGGSPTAGFLSHAHGPFEAIFKSLAGLPMVDWLFMAGLLFVGLTFLFNRYIKWGSVAGMAMVLLMYLAALPPENHPILDEHIVYAFVFGLFLFQKNTPR